MKATNSQLNQLQPMTLKCHRLKLAQIQFFLKIHELIRLGLPEPKPGDSVRIHPKNKIGSGERLNKLKYPVSYQWRPIKASKLDAIGTTYSKKGRKFSLTQVLTMKTTLLRYTSSLWAVCWTSTNRLIWKLNLIVQHEVADNSFSNDSLLNFKRIDELFPVRFLIVVIAQEGPRWPPSWFDAVVNDNLFPVKMQEGTRP